MTEKKRKNYKAITRLLFSQLRWVRRWHATPHGLSSDIIIYPGFRVYRKVETDERRRKKISRTKARGHQSLRISRRAIARLCGLTSLSNDQERFCIEILCFCFFCKMASSKKNPKSKRVNLKSVDIETKVFVDEATGHLKTGIYDKALELYSKVFTS